MIITSVVLPLELREKVKNLAKQEHRSLSAQLVVLIRQALAANHVPS